MGALCHPYTSPQDIHGRGGEKRLKTQLVGADVARPAHFTGAHRLRNGSFHPSSLGVRRAKFRRQFSFASLMKGLIGLFLGLEDQHACGTVRTLLMKRTRLTDRWRETHPDDLLPMVIVNHAPALASLRRWARHLVSLPIDGKLAVIKTRRLLCLPTHIGRDRSDEINLIADLTLGKHLRIDIARIAPVADQVTSPVVLSVHAAVP